jgi:hypothetical protein
LQNVHFTCTPEGYRKDTGKIPEGYLKDTGRIPEGYRKDTGRLPEGYRTGARILSRGSRSRIAILLARQKDTGRILEGYQKGRANERLVVGIKNCQPAVKHHQYLAANYLSSSKTFNLP